MLYQLCLKEKNGIRLALGTNAGKKMRCQMKGGEEAEAK